MPGHLFVKQWEIRFGQMVVHSVGLKHRRVQVNSRILLFYCLQLLPSPT